MGMTKQRSDNIFDYINLQTSWILDFLKRVRFNLSWNYHPFKELNYPFRLLHGNNYGDRFHYLRRKLSAETVSESSVNRPPGTSRD